jgi:hypothetical protein
VAVAALGDPTSLSPFAAGMLAWYQAKVGHEGAGGFESPKVSDLRGEHHRRNELNAAQALQCLYHWLEAPVLDELCDILRQLLDARGCLLDGVQVLNHDAVLCFMIKMLVTYPIQMRAGPACLSRVLSIVSQQELDELMSCGALGGRVRKLV